QSGHDGLQICRTRRARIGSDSGRPVLPDLGAGAARRGRHRCCDNATRSGLCRAHANSSADSARAGAGRMSDRIAKSLPCGLATGCIASTLLWALTTLAFTAELPRFNTWFKYAPSVTNEWVVTGDDGDPLRVALHLKNAGGLPKRILVP